MAEISPNFGDREIMEDVLASQRQMTAEYNAAANQKVYGIEMWEHALGDMTMEEYLKNQVLSELAQVKSMVLLAGEQEITAARERFTGTDS